jgi:hypothetical protein
MMGRSAEPTAEADRGRHPGFARHEGFAGGPGSLSLSFGGGGLLAVAEHDPATAGQDGSPGGVLTAEQRATFRSAGFWMAIVGWAEVVFGGLAGMAFVLPALGAIPGQGAASAEVRFLLLQAIGSVLIGVNTLGAARSFRRAGQNPTAGLTAVTEAVGGLAELYERQVWLAGLFLVFAVAGALARWW